MGWLIEGRCYVEPETAAYAYVAAIPPAVTVVDGDRVEWIAGVGFDCCDFNGWPSLNMRKEVNGQYVTEYAFFPSTVPCDPAESFADGAVLGWGVAACLIAAFAYKLFQRAAR